MPNPITACCGTGDWSGPLPGDPSTNATLSATPILGGIRVSWTWPTVNSYAVAHVQVYRNTVNSSEGAMQIAIVANSYHLDYVEGGNGYYYWIKIVSIYGTVSEFIGPAYADPIATGEQLMEELTGRIDRSVLALALKEELDSISIIRDDLWAEITARENADISLQDAVTAAQQGVADALTFITTVQSSMTSELQAMAEQIDLVAATLDDSYGAVIESMTVSIDAATDAINTMYTIRLTANGLAGGFGIHNDATTVEAGFDVDTFWVGRTSADKVKPFIITDGVVYIDSAMIKQVALVGTDNFSVKSAETGQRMEMNGQAIKVFDAAGTKRVQMGNLLV